MLDKREQSAWETVKLCGALVSPDVMTRDPKALGRLFNAGGFPKVKEDVEYLLKVLPATDSRRDGLEGLLTILQKVVGNSSG